MSRTRGSVELFTSTVQPRSVRRTNTSGTTYSALALLTVAPGRGCSPRTSATACASSSSEADELAAQQRELAVGEQVEMFVGDGQREAQARRVGMQRAQLQREAFAEVARGDAGRIERLHELSTRSTSVGVGRDFGQQRGGDVVERVGEVAVVVDRIDDGARDGEFARREIGVFELADEVILQRERGVVGDFGGALVVIAPGIGARAAFAPVVFDDLGFDGDFGSRLRVDALLLRHRMRFERFELPVASYSSTGSSMTLLSSCSRMCACSSSAGICRRRMACCSCGVMVSV